MTFLLIILTEIKIKKGVFLDKSQTTAVNGIFIIVVFFSHFFGYYESISGIDLYLRLFIGRIGQLMVTTFFFFSGYGIHEQLVKKEGYINNFFKKRFIPTYFNFVVGVLLYLLLNLVLNIKYSLMDNLLAFTGFSSIGNSNWYMFSIFIIYIALLFVYKTLNDKKKQIVLFTCLLIIYSIIINIIKGDLWASTILLFPFGMWCSYFKDKIKLLFDEKIKFFHFIILFICFGIMYIVSCKIYYTPFYIFSFNITSLLFVSLIMYLMKIFTFKSNGLLFWFGKNLFWIYIIQRLPMIVLCGKINMYLAFVISFIITILLTLLFSKISSLIFRKEEARK